MDLQQWANTTIPQPSKGVVMIKKRYGLSDISNLCNKGFNDDNHEVAQFAKRFPANIQGLKMLFDFCDANFSYTEDPSEDENGQPMNVQAIQSPSALWHLTKDGDCKSYTVFIASCIYHMGLPVEMCLVDYGNEFEKHIYPRAILNGQRIPVDAVYKKQQGGAFGTEKIPYKMIKNIIKKPGLYKVGKIAPTATEDDYIRYANDANAAVSDIPESVLEEDITAMTQGEFDRWQMAQRLKAFAKHETDAKLKGVYNKGIAALQTASISGIGAMAATPFGKKLSTFIQKTKKDNAPAFQNFKVGIPGVQPEVSGLFSKIKNAVKKVAKAIGGAIKKLANAFYKGGASDAAPFFLYQFLSPAQLSRAKPEVRRRKAAQDKLIGFLTKKGKLGTRSQILASMATGIKDKFGFMPEQILAESSQQKVGVVVTAAVGVGAAVQKIIKDPAIVKKAFKVILGIGKKILSIFKKKDKKDEEFERLSNEANNSDLTLLFDGEKDFGNQAIVDTDLPADGQSDVVSADTGGGNKGLLIGLAAAAAAAVLVMKK